MKTFPLQSLTLIEAQQKQFGWWTRFAVIFLAASFLPAVIGLNAGAKSAPHYPACGTGAGDAFHAQAAALVQGAGTGAILRHWRLCSNRGSVFWCMTRLLPDDTGYY